MSERRRHLLVLLIVLGLIAGSLIGRVHPGRRRHEARPRPPGRRPAHLPGQADQGDAGQRGVAPARAGHHARPRRRVRRRRAGARAHGRGPDRRQPPRRRGRRARRRSGRVDRPALLLRLGEERPRRELQDQPERDHGRPAARHRPLQRGQARLQVRDQGPREQPGGGRRRASTRSTRSPRSRSTTASRASRAPRRSTGSTTRSREKAEVIEVKPGVLVLRDREARADVARSRRLLGHPRRPGPLRHRHQEPGAELRPARRQRADRHLRLLRQGPQGVPGHHRARSRSAAPTTPTRSTRTRSRTRSTSRSRSTTSSSRSRSSTTARTRTASTARPAPRSPAASRSPAPRTWRRCSRPARCRCGSS